MGVIWSFLLPITLSSSPSLIETLILPGMPSSSFRDPLNFIMVACVSLGMELFTTATHQWLATPLKKMTPPFPAAINSNSLWGKDVLTQGCLCISPHPRYHIAGPISFPPLQTTTTGANSHPVRKTVFNAFLLIL